MTIYSVRTDENVIIVDLGSNYVYQRADIVVAERRGMVK